MALRPGRTTRRVERPWTRVSQRKPKKSYVVGVPYPKIHVFEMGSKIKQFDTSLWLVMEDSMQIRENSLESARIKSNKYLEKFVGLENYFMKVLTYPHQILREHTLATGAGADRFSMGMRLAFGRPKGRAIITSKGKKIFLLKVDKSNLAHAKKALHRAIQKLPGSCKVVVGN